MDGEKIGIKETEEALDFSISLIEDLADHRADDGKVDLFEAGQTVASNAPAGIRAIMGADAIDDELKDLDPEEVKALMPKAVQLMRAVMALVKGPSEEE